MDKKWAHQLLFPQPVDIFIITRRVYIMLGDVCARWARAVDAPDPVLWGPATLPETTPRKPAPSREGGLWRLAGGRRAARPDWRRSAPRVGWTRSCTPKWGQRKACTGSNSRVYTLFIVKMARWRRWDKGAGGATQMMQCAQAVQGCGGMPVK